MSNALNGTVPAAFLNAIATLIAADATAAKVLVETQPAAAATATSPLFWGGASVIDITASSADSVARDVVLWLGQVATVVGAATGSASTTSSAVNRTTGDFVADGWKPGDLLMCFAAAGAARQATDGILGIVTGVSATALTLNGTPLSALTLSTGVRICRVSPQFRTTIAAGAGTNGSVPSAALMNNSMDGATLRYEKKLAATELLAVSAAAAVSALPAYVSVSADVARY